MNKKRLSTEQMSFVIYEPPGELPECDRPRTRLLRDGAAVCSTVELLQVLIGGRYAERAARQLLGHGQDLRGIASMPVRELASRVEGLGEKKALQLKACFELGKRLFTQPAATRPQIKTPADAAQLLMPEVGLLDQEEVRVIMLDTRNRILATTMVYRGALNMASMRVCELFKEAIRLNAASIILIHNHPSNDPTPSAEDVRVTKEVIKAGQLLDIELLDHLVLTADCYVSLKERGLAFGE